MDVWPIDKKSGVPPEGWNGWPDGKRFALVLTHDVETIRGHDKCRELVELESSLSFCSSFNFVPEDYPVSPELRRFILDKGFEVGVHGLKHDGRLYQSREFFMQRGVSINRYLKEWGSVGFRSPSMHRNLEWIGELDIEYDASTFDTDPFEPQADGAGTIFPFCVPRSQNRKKYVELPYTLPQDFALFVLMEEKDPKIWKEKLDWIVDCGGMALLDSHPDYMNFGNGKLGSEEYPVQYYRDFLEYVGTRYKGLYWHVLPKEMARFWFSNYHDKGARGIPVRKKIWIDLDNSPHVPFFKPIIEHLRKLDYSTLITARDSYQVIELADFMGVDYKKIGRHYGKNKFMKFLGFLYRTLQLMPIALKEKPDLAISHGSRSQILTSSLLGITSIAISDYEYSSDVVSPTWALVPELMHKDKIKHYKKGVLGYPGIKEDVYVPYFQPNPDIIDELGVDQEKVLIIVRPPAVEAHYHTVESEYFFEQTMDFLGNIDNICMIVLPRNDRQRAFIKHKWPGLYAKKKMLMPERVFDGLNLLWHADLVIGGGGTMNREATALGVPVYCIFRGRVGEVDKYLNRCGRLVFLETEEDLKNKLKLVKRNRLNDSIQKQNDALTGVMNNIIKVLENIS